MRVVQVLCGIVLLLLTAAANAQTVLKFGLSQSETSSFYVGAKAMADDFAKRTQDRHKITIYAGGTLGGEPELIESLKKGSLDLCLVATGPLGKYVPDTLILDIPFLFRDYEHARRVLDGPIGQELLGKISDNAIIGLAWGESGFRNLTNSQHAILAPEDLEGMRIGIMENSVHMAAFKALAATPMPLPLPEVYMALQVGLVDGQENPIQVIVSSKFAQVQKYLSMTGHIYSPAPYLGSPAMYKKLSDADKNAMVEAAKVGAAAMRKSVNEIEAKGLDELKKQGMAVVGNVDKSKFQTALAPAYAEYATKFGAQNIERIRNYK